jgi:transglutaminase-like putative cysteine protease
VAGRIREEFRYVAGATTVDSSIEDLLAGGAGVCQDFTHLFIDMARHMGWPARYVSGYVGPSDAEDSVEGASHAWAEVCGSDRHWVGLDPTHGGVTGRRHLRLAVGRDYGDVPPHRGLFFGSAAGSQPEVTVRISRVGPRHRKPVNRGGTLHWQQQQQ